ncbi:Cytochrome c oxidase subunit 2 precursor [Pirellulimonas nuda]|uniref:Cytochrome c oxidase subunit 2 n=1 Tax=Pirellulimonas nuda TaxID=2528009 RepID=A0A518D8U3_9BACT|nr:cytochrome c oxidase subunit II [Pirellulimonas nuda]QDU87893.1 Cytochrome c oxidase subunit 2 precursor [Pirellulimonas nuda]
MFPVFQPESPQAQAIFDLFVTVLQISTAIFTIVAVLIVVAVWRGRRRSALPKQAFGDHRTEMVWIAGPLVVLVWITAISANLVLTINAVPKVHLEQAEAGAADITVTGHQWWWEIAYSDSGLVSANEIYLPTGKRLRVKLQSADVIHCFWVPQLARKMDAIPGRENYIWLEANRPGVYQGRCAEYCGTQHAWMNFKVYALSPSDYARWQAKAGRAPADPAEADALAGERLFFSLTCANCHTVRGTRADATIGPDLTDIASRKELGGGVLENSRENLTRWLKDPQSVKPGSKMPNFQLNDEHVRQLVAYLESLD